MEWSAKISGLDKSKQFGSSFVKILKSLGPSKDPCGTPEKIFMVVELKPLIDTYCFLLLR